MTKFTAIGVALVTVIVFHGGAFAQFGPTPKGEPTVVAQKLIRDNFEEEVCPLVVDARRLGDETIRALCNNGEIFRVFGRFAMRCSVVAEIGVSGC